jgi:hypothetical protein
VKKYIIKKNTEALLNVCKEVQVQLNSMMKSIFMSHQQRTTQNHYERAPNESFKNMAKLKHLGIRVKNQIAFTRKLRKN